MNTISPKLISNKKIKKLSPIQKERGRNNVSFKGGVPESLIKEADRAIVDVFAKNYGDIADTLGRKLGSLATEVNKEEGLSYISKAGKKLLQKSSRFSMEQGASSIVEKKIGRSIAENVIFPFVNLPLYGANWLVHKAKNIPGLQNGAESLYRSSILRIPRKLNEMDWKTDSLKGIMDKTNKTVVDFAKKKGIDPAELLKKLADKTSADEDIVKEANEYIQENLYKVGNKFFDKHTGNFNTAYERPLNRIVTGLIPVAFLANDAYNLSVLCGDKKEDSKKEAVARRNQEISRVFTTAYIQLLTFGAFTKQVNTKAWFTPLTSALTVLYSEITSRKKHNKPVFFLTKEKAKEINRKNKDSKSTSFKSQAETKPSETKQNETKSDIKFDNKQLINGATPKIFTSFKAKDKKAEKEKKADEPKKALMNFQTFKKGVLILTTAGFALSFLKNSSLTKNTKFMQAFKDIGTLWNKKIYNPIAFKDFEMTEQTFSEVTGSLKNIAGDLKASGCEAIANGHVLIKDKYGAARYGQAVPEGIIKMYKTSLSSTKVPKVLTGVMDKLTGTGAKFDDEAATVIKNAIRTAIKHDPTSIAETKYENIAEKALGIIKKRGIEFSEKEMETFANAVKETITENASINAVQVETKAKPFIDILIQPFKFVSSAAQLPFKIFSTVLKMAVSPIEKKALEAELGGPTLNNVEKSIHKAVTEIFGEKTPKAGKISQTVFTNAMEELTKKTAPYRNAKKALEEISKNGTKDEIAKAQKLVEKTEHKLQKYLYDAIEKSFNGVTQSSNKNTDLAMMSKLASSTVTSAFLVADNYNMVMLKSDGEDKEGAKEKANERIVQRLSALFYQTLFINWFNSTFRATYNSSLRGMTAVAIPNTLTTEIFTRKSIGMPIGRKTMDELQEIDEKNEKRTGFTGKYFKFMRLLTGKKPLKDRLPKDKQQSNVEVKPTTQDQVKVENKTTNLLEQYSK